MTRNYRRPVRTQALPHNIETINVSARIDCDIADLLTEIAKDQGVSRNLLMNEILRDFVDEYTK